MKVKEHCHGKPTVGIVKHQNLNMIKELNSYHILGKLNDMNLVGCMVVIKDLKVRNFIKRFITVFA